MAAWPPGTPVIQQSLWNGNLLSVRPALVADDGADYLALYFPPGSETQRGDLGSQRRALPFEQVIETYLDPEPPILKSGRQINRHVLTLTPPNDWCSIWLFWDAAWTLQCYFVNFQQPLERTRRGVLERDCALDIRIEPDRNWTWKDRDEFDALQQRGFFADLEQRGLFAADTVERVESCAANMVQRIETWSPPFNAGWEDWRPPADWPLPELPGDWAELN